MRVFLKVLCVLYDGIVELRLITILVCLLSHCNKFDGIVLIHHYGVFCVFTILHSQVHTFASCMHTYLCVYTYICIFTGREHVYVSYKK